MRVGAREAGARGARRARGGGARVRVGPGEVGPRWGSAHAFPLPVLLPPPQLLSRLLPLVLDCNVVCILYLVIFTFFINYFQGLELFFY